MTQLSYRTLDDGTTTLPEHALAAFAPSISGGVLQPGDPDYDQARQVWNGMVDRHPALIARCENSEDVRNAILFAKAQRMLLSVRGGGHHIAGNAVAEQGLMIDLSSMRGVEIDPAARRAYVQPGALLGDLDKASQAHGLATPTGINSTTGVAGLCLGGGFGWLTRKYGMTVDNLVGAELVDADGQLHQVSTQHEQDLFWAIRGGGGNFGVVTRFEFALHPVGPEVSTGLVVYPLEQARQVLQAWREFCAAAPLELSVWAVLRQAPPLPFLPEAAHGQPVVILAALHCGEVEAGEQAIKPLLDFGQPLGSALGAQPYAAFQQAFDPLLASGARNYWKSHNLGQISDKLIDVAVDAATHLPTPETEVFIAQLGGAAADVQPDATAYVGRDANFVMNVHGRWQQPEDDERVRNWARMLFEEVRPFATGGGYVNFFTADENERTQSAYGTNYPRLQALKRRYDPENLFRLNLNIQA